MAESHPVTLTQPRNRHRIRLGLTPGRSHVVGSSHGCDTVLAGDGISERHAELAWSDGKLWVTPIASAPVTVNGHSISARAALADGDWLAFSTVLHQVEVGPMPLAEASGAAPAAAATEFVPRPEEAETAEVPLESAPEAVRAAVSGELSVGRESGNDIQIESPIVSRRHARLVPEDGGVVLEDLGSVNGTFVNGRRVSGRIPLRGGERVEFGSFAYLFDGEGLSELQGAGSIRVDVRGLEQTVTDIATGAPKAILQDIDLSFLPGEFVVVFGTSGSGKSTLVDALNGRRRASGGSVLYNETDLYDAYDLFRATIGYVPQQDIVHRRITVRRAIRYAARLRLPSDTSAEEIEEHVARVLDRVGLSDKIDQPIDTPSPLSGGQLKRVSVAVELVSNPSIVFLDEATSGLDAGTDRKLMDLFAELARDNKTVVCVTHTLESVDACDLVVLLHRGRLVYFGPPQDALAHFGISRLSDVYDTLESKPAEHWAEHYRASELHSRYVESRLVRQVEETAPVDRQPAKSGGRPALALRQAGILLQRYLDLIRADARSLAMSLLPAPAIGLLIGYVWSAEGTILEQAAVFSQVCFTLALAAIWLGCLNASREIVKEQPVYMRERAVNLGLLPYVVSKFIPIAAICTVQCLALLGATRLLLDLPGSFASQALVLSASGIAGAAMGLAVSAFVATTDRAIATVPLLLVPQLIFSNVFPLPATAAAIAKVSMVSFWSFDALKATLGPEVLNAVDPFRQKAAVAVEGSLGFDLAAIAALTVVFMAAVFVGLRLKDRQL